MLLIILSSVLLVFNVLLVDLGKLLRFRILLLFKTNIDLTNTISER